MKKLRVLMLVHSELLPPDDLQGEDDPRMNRYRTEHDVRKALIALGHEVRLVGVDDDLTPIRNAIDQWKPHIAYNLLEAFAGHAALDYYVVSYLDMLRVPYTGCNPRGLVLSRDKALSKKILSYHRIKVPRFKVFRWGRTVDSSKLGALPFPMVVKSLNEQGSVAIAQASLVQTPQELVDRVVQVQEMTGDDAIAEEYIEGRELYVTVVGNQRLEVLPIRELIFQKGDPDARIATYKVKWDERYREKRGIDYQFARPLPSGMNEAIVKLCKRIYRILDLSGYARMDLRVRADGRIFVLEANPNAAIANNEDVAFSAEKAGLRYEQFIQRIVNLGLRAARRSGK